MSEDILRRQIQRQGPFLWVNTEGVTRCHIYIVVKSRTIFKKHDTNTVCIKARDFKDAAYA